MKLKQNQDKVKFRMKTGKDFVESEMSIVAVNSLISKGKVTKSKQFKDFQICVDGKYHFDGTFEESKQAKEQCEN